MFYGSITAMVTPINEPCSDVDLDAMQKLIEHHIEAGTHAIVSVGTTGESATLNIEENVKTILKAVEFAAGRIPVICGCEGDTTHRSYNDD